MIDTTKPVQTRDGRKARIVCTDVVGPYPILVLVTHKDGEEYTYYYYATGRLKKYEEDPLDLVNVPEQTVRYIGVKIDHTGKQGREPEFGWDNQIKLTYEGDKLVAVEIVE